MLIAAVLGAGALTAFGNGSAVGHTNLAPNGIGTVRFGLTKSRAVTQLTALFGAPAGRGVNTGCRPRYTEVEWGDLVAEFRSNTFSGYRYIVGGYPLTTAGSPHEAATPKVLSPDLATSTEITLGSTIAQARAAYGTLRLTGAETWETPNGLDIVDNANVGKLPPTRIYEIKIGTCGDF
jgi:hypothetical protein